MLFFLIFSGIFIIFFTCQVPSTKWGRVFIWILAKLFYFCCDGDRNRTDTCGFMFVFFGCCWGGYSVARLLLWRSVKVSFFFLLEMFGWRVEQISWCFINSHMLAIQCIKFFDAPRFHDVMCSLVVLQICSLDTLLLYSASDIFLYTSNMQSCCTLFLSVVFVFLAYNMLTC